MFYVLQNFIILSPESKITFWTFLGWSPKTWTQHLGRQRFLLLPQIRWLYLREFIVSISQYGTSLLGGHLNTKCLFSWSAWDPPPEGWMLSRFHEGVSCGFPDCSSGWEGCSSLLRWLAGFTSQHTCFCTAGLANVSLCHPNPWNVNVINSLK